MANLTGTSGNDTLDGTSGDDTLDGGRGTDILNGADGNDIFLVDGFDTNDQFNGGNGTDTIRLTTPPLILTGPNGPMYSYIAGGVTFNSIERLEFNSPSGVTSQFVAFTPQFGAGLSNNLELVGSAGSDIMIVFATAAGDYTMPSFVRTNWTTNTNVNATDGDLVVLLGSGSGNFTLRATDVHTGIEYLQGGDGNDTLIGGSSQDYLSTIGGIDNLSAGGGNDFLAAINGQGQFNNFAGSTFDGGTGTDTMIFGGYVSFNGTANSIEHIRLLPEILSGPTLAGRPATYLDITESVADQFDVTLIEGEGTIGYTMESTSFDASQITIAAGSNIQFEVFGTIGNDAITGSTSDDTLFGDEGNDTLNGAAGNDTLWGYDGNDTMTGGAGNDIFVASHGNDVIMDFTVGQDKIAVPTVVANMEMLQPFLSQVGNDTVITHVYGGVQYTLTLKNVALSSLDASSFVGEEAIENDPGTAGNDMLFGSSFGDFFDGLGGNDLIFAGADGWDQINAGDGNDTVIVTASGPPTQYNPFHQGVYDGGLGTDILRISTNGLSHNAAPVTYLASFLASTVSGFETLEMQTSAGDRLQALFTLSQMTGVSINGGQGSDIVVLQASSVGDITMPNLTRTNWSLDLSPTSSPTQVLNSDILMLAAAGGSNGSTLRANTNHAGTEGLLGSGGSDVLLGGNDTEYLFGGVAGADQLHGGGGTDFLAITEQASLSGQGSYADDLFDGGSGTDYLTATGNVAFAGTLQNVEGIDLVISTVNNNGVISSTGAQLTIGSDIAQALGANALLRGNGSVIVNATPGATVNLTGWQFETAPIAVTINGSSNADTLIGSTRGDTLYGGLGDDILVGGAGADTIDGGDGNDRIVYDTADASVSGGAGNDILVVFEGDALPTGFDLGGHAFEAAQQTIHDSGANSWASIANTYNGLWHLVQQDTSNDDGSRVVVDLDPEDVASTTQVWTVYDTQGQLDSIDQIFDAGGHTFTNFDQANASAMAQDWFVYDSQNRLDNEDVYYDDGTRTFINVDEDGSKNWSQDWFAYDAQARLSSEDVLYDDGSRTFINLDEASNQSWSQDWFAYDNQGRLSSEDVFYDDGTRTYINLDEDNSQVWSQAWFTYDSQGRLDTQDVFNDDGTRIFYNYDEDSTQPFVLTAFLYDNVGHAYQQIIQWDNGTTDYINL